MNLELKAALGDDSRATDYGGQFVFPPLHEQAERNLGNPKKLPFLDNQKSQQTINNTDD